MNRYIFNVKPEYVLCMQKSNGDYVFRSTKNGFNMDVFDHISRKQRLNYDKNVSSFFTTGLYDQFDHKYICRFIQYKLDICDLSKTILGTYEHFD